jgi:L-ectoine synthase
MIIFQNDELKNVGREYHSKSGDFISRRFLLKKDGVPFTMTETIIKAGAVMEMEYKNHIEACYCVEGNGVLVNKMTGENFQVQKGFFYCLDQHDPHQFQAKTQCTLICVFNPPLNGDEDHLSDGSYSQ